MSEEQDPETQKECGILTGDEIKALGIVEPSNVFDERCFSNASVDFCLGEHFYFPHEYEREKIKKGLSGQLNEDEQLRLIESQIYDCSKSGLLIIPKFTSVVIETYEELAIPNDIAGRFDLRIKWAIAGLVLQVGTQIEPGYKGKLWGLLHNFSSEQIIIRYKNYDDRLFTAEFSFTSKPTPPTEEKLKKPRDMQHLLLKYPVRSGSLFNYFEQFDAAKEKVEAKVTEAVTTIEKRIDTKIVEIEILRSSIDSTIQTVNQSNERVNAAAERVNQAAVDVNNLTVRRFAWAFGLGTFFITLVLPTVLSILITKLTFNKDDYQIFNNSKQVRITTDSLRNQIDVLKKLIKSHDSLSEDSIKTKSVKKPLKK